jgi:prefoldin subunit 5
METELESGGVLTEQVQSQMDLLERKITSVVSTLAAADPERAEAELSALRDEMKLLHDERESIAGRIAELLDKLDTLST